MMLGGIAATHSGAQFGLVTIATAEKKIPASAGIVNLNRCGINE